MIELKYVNNWSSPLSAIIPTANLTPSDQKKLDERADLIEKIRDEVANPLLWIKITSGLFKGTICQATRWTGGARSRSGTAAFEVVADVETINPSKLGRISYIPEGIEHQAPNWAPTRCHWSVAVRSQDPIKFKEGTLYPAYLSSTVTRSCSLLLDYTGGPVFCMNEKRRPSTFEDRLGQEVNLNDLVVVAYNYGGGLDICMVRGFADETRVVVESVETGALDRIPLVDNATHKIMRLPNKLEDIAMLMKLARI